ncbi:MAG TPA: FGGY-family carbohydrate kinase [Solimonas sp.]|nr:FGGY-family carbohydrate kinase [Solimonas sp.]
MNARTILSLDVGTQSARALVFDAHGKLLAKAQEVFAKTYESPRPGWAEQDPEIYWRAIVACCQRLWRDGAVSARDVAALSVTTQRSTVICVDADGEVLRPAIVWLDQRRAVQPPDLGIAWRSAFRLVGAHHLIAQVQREAEANWLAEQQPEIWRRTARFLLLSGWLNWRLCGAYVDSAGSQVGYLPFDYKRLDWAGPRDFKWRALAVRREQLPELVPPSATLGALTGAAADALGLPAGLPLIAAAADKACEVLGSGAVEPDVAQLSFGTTATINTTQSRYIEVQRLVPAYPAAQPHAWNTEIQIYRGFWMVSWFRREFAMHEERLAAERGVAVETLFDELVRTVPAGAMGLTLQPYWSPGVRIPGPEAKGAIIGFGDVHTRAHLYRAILEGLIYGLRGGCEQIEKKLRRPVRLLRVAGGGSQSDTAMQITADVFNRPAERPSIYETSGLGAAINAAVALGWHADHATAVRAMTRVGRRFEPDPAAVKVYDALYREVYSRMYGRLQPLYRSIRRITGYPA